MIYYSPKEAKYVNVQYTEFMYNKAKTCSNI